MIGHDAFELIELAHEEVISTCDLDNDNVIATYWMDIDRKSFSGSSQHMDLRPSPATASSVTFRY